MDSELLPLSPPCVNAAVELDGHSREVFYRAAVSRLNSIEADAKVARQLGVWIGGAGLLTAIIASTATAMVFLSKPQPPPPGFVLVDRQSGVIGPATAAPDAPKLFGEMTNERTLRDFIARCTGFVPQTWRLDFHACMVMASPDEQQRLAAALSPGGPDYPPDLFGKGGWAMPTRFLAFVDRDAGSHGTLHYQVRYERTEMANGRETRPHYTADVQFQCHPERPMSAEDRLLNPGGFQCVSFSSVRDD